MENRQIILGPPGTGKTTFLMNTIETLLQEGVRPNKIGFFSFSKKAANEAMERAYTRFGYTSKELPYFRTIHSLAYSILGIKKDDMISRRDLLDFSKIVGIEISGRGAQDDDLGDIKDGDKILSLENLSRNRKESLYETYKEFGDTDISWTLVERVAKQYNQFKTKHMLYDFTDILQQLLDHPFSPQLDALIIDEAQDLSAMQWDIVDKLEKTSSKIYIAGDDDQAIFRWAGADIDKFISLKGETKVLDRSWRVPESVHHLAHRVINHVKHRRDKTWDSRDEEGSIWNVHDLDDIDLSKGQWMILARNACFLRDIEEYCREFGLPYEIKGWSPLRSDDLQAIRYYVGVQKGRDLNEDQKKHLYKYMNKKLSDELDLSQPWYNTLPRIGRRRIDYFRTLLKRGESLTDEPRIKIGTIHSSKGGEAENVVLLSDIATRTYEAMEDGDEDEFRVLYVGITRTKKNLYLLQPKTDRSYEQWIY